ncbi:MAG: IS1595 family transposase, partial [Chloroflexota bacterium]|nr:IS1595 family transposase [Chloroflexota bacterium]
VVAVKDRATNRIAARPVARTDKATLQGFVQRHTAAGAAVYTDEHPSYRGLPNHQAVKHSIGEYVKGQVSTNGVESFWSMVKRGYHGTFHHFSPKHLHRYINEFAGRHNVRDRDTLHQMALLATGLDGKRLKYRDLIAGPPAYP